MHSLNWVLFFERPLPVTTSSETCSTFQFVTDLMKICVRWYYVNPFEFHTQVKSAGLWLMTMKESCKISARVPSSVLKNPYCTVQGLVPMRL